MSQPQESWWLRMEEHPAITIAALIAVFMVLQWVLVDGQVSFVWFGLFTILVGIYSGIAKWRNLIHAVLITWISSVLYIIAFFMMRRVYNTVYNTLSHDDVFPMVLPIWMIIAAILGGAVTLIAGGNRRLSERKRNKL